MLGHIQLCVCFKEFADGGNATKFCSDPGRHHTQYIDLHLSEAAFS